MSKKIFKLFKTLMSVFVVKLRYSETYNFQLEIVKCGRKIAALLPQHYLLNRNKSSWMYL